MIVLVKIYRTDDRKIHEEEELTEGVWVQMVNPSEGEGEEYATVFYGEKCNTFIHEICHLYGACDLYYTDFVKEKVRRYLGGSIMCYNVLYVDDVTAYVIGWQKELTDMDSINE